MFRLLLLDGRRHFQLDLAREYECSPQSIARMAGVIEDVIGISLESGIDQRKKYYQIRSINRRMLPLDYEELRYLSICRDLAGHLLPEEAAKRVDNTIFNLSLLMADQAYANRENIQKSQVTFFRKWHIDYSPHQAVIERLLLGIEEKRVCLVHYKAAGKESAREHRIVPGSLISQSNALYLLGAKVTPRNQFQTLTNMAVHRIQEVDLTDKRSDIEMPQTDPGLFGLPWHEPRKVRIQFKAGKAANYVRERLWSTEQTIEELEDGGIVLEILSQSDEELMSFVRSFGENAKLLS